jgi:glyoxylase-like metal-dependent hydrolase (beta-lactamase superfamily II)
MFFRQILHPEKSCASYLVGCPTFHTCVAIDPQGDPDRYLAIVDENDMQLTGVFDTHVHADHVSSARALAGKSGAPLYAGPGTPLGFAHAELADGQVIPSGNRKIAVIHTPGHTAEHVSLSIDDWFVLTGDTLFVGDVGRVDLSLSDVSQVQLVDRVHTLQKSLRKLLTLPDWTEIFPGHYSGSVCGKGMDGKPISTIGREKRDSRPLQLSDDALVHFLTENLPPLPDSFREIKKKNLGM